MIFANSPVLSLAMERIGMSVLIALDLELDLDPVMSSLLVDLHIILTGQNLALDQNVNRDFCLLWC